MLNALRHPAYLRLFLAQVVAMIGTGVLTVALGLLAYDLAGAQAGAVLGVALALKMLANVVLSPVMTALTSGVPRKAVMIGADLIRACVALSLPFVSEIWQVYAAIFTMQVASATFTPLFQATIPEVLPEERDYTAALTLSRIAYDMESLASPILAAALLGVMSSSNLFLATVAGFLGSALFVALARLPRATPPKGGFLERLTTGLTAYLRRPALRGLLAVSLATASAGAFVFTNSVVVVREVFHRPETALTAALTAFGAGSMLMALALLRSQRTPRAQLVVGALGMNLAALLGGLALPALGWPGFLALWFTLGLGYAASATATGRVLRAEAEAAALPLPALFAAQFALSHACWMLTYPLAGKLGTLLPLPQTLAAMGALGLTAALLATVLWRRAR